MPHKIFYSIESIDNIPFPAGVRTGVVRLRFVRGSNGLELDNISFLSIQIYNQIKGLKHVLHLKLKKRYSYFQFYFYIYRLKHIFCAFIRVKTF